MKTLLTKALLLALALVCLKCSPLGTKVEVLSVAEFKSKLNELGRDAILLDVRTADEVEQGKIKNAVHIDFYQDDFESRINILDKEATYFVYCGSGVRSKKTARIMARNGFTLVYDLEGGIGAWIDAGEPTN